MILWFQREHRPRPSSRGFQFGQRPRKRNRVPAPSHRRVVAAMLSLQPRLMGHPPDHRVIKQDRLDQY
ncbi:MAG: hypothetical protein R3B67_14090, partial [Phycisphaerales bacterium]